ncbi:MAG: hypothetical protein R6U88_06865 [Candidatus Bipolaricaulota bacterium]
MNKPLRAVFFDLDGTLVRYRGVGYESSWGPSGFAEIPDLLRAAGS